MTRWLRLMPDSVFDGEKSLPGAAVDLDIDGGIIAAVHPALPDHAEPAHDLRLERLSGYTIAPGLVDLQVNGGGGFLLNEDPTPETLRAIVEAHGRTGSTSILPTLITSSRPILKKAADAAREVASSLPAMLGLHLEGPHLSGDRAGIHDPALMRKLTKEDIDRYGKLCNDIGKPLVITVAPEVVTPMQIKELVSRGIRVALGHSNATAEQATAAIKAGASLVTHLFNAMSGVGARQPGLAGVALTDPGVRVGFIADGHHLHRATVDLVLAAAPNRVHIVSDALSPAGGGGNHFKLAGRELSVVDGVCQSADGTFAGPARPLAECLRWMVSDFRRPLEEALRLVTSAPADAIGEPVGRIAVGAPADLVLVDSGGAIIRVMRRARWEQLTLPSR